MEIAEALKSVREKINNSAVKAGRDSDNIKLIAVTKTVTIERIIEAVKAGVSILGENRVQEAREKKVRSYELGVRSEKIEWHLIGPLQTNKAKVAVQLFDLIHSVDSIKLAEELDKQAGRIGEKQRILVEVKLSEEETKHGVADKDLMELLAKISDMKNLKLEGLMTIPPFFEDPEKTRPYFKRLRELRDNINELRACLSGRQVTRYALRDLSMGMSNDFEVAIEEGATMVRIGTAIFGGR